MSLVSVIMPLYNAERFVLSAIRSVLDQTWRDLELIVVDDASTDRSPELVAGVQDSRVRFFRNGQNEGAAGARNHALAEARGDWFCFLDADDIALPHRIERQVGWLTDPEVTLLATKTIPIDEEGNRIEVPMPGVEASERIPARLLFQNCLAQSSVLMRRSDVRFDAAFVPAEDYDLWTRMAGEGKRFAILEEPLVMYRHHAGAVSRRREDRMRAAVRSIQLRGIGALGLEPDETAHALSANPDVHATSELVSRAGQWLLALRDANRKREVYDLRAFEQVLEERWFRVCIDAFPLGWEAWRIYSDSPLANASLAQKATFLRRVVPQVIRGR